MNVIVKVIYIKLLGKNTEYMTFSPKEFIDYLKEEKIRVFNSAGRVASF